MEADPRHDFNNLLVKLRSLVQLIGGADKSGERKTLEAEGDRLIGEILRAWEEVKRF